MLAYTQLVPLDNPESELSGAPVQAAKQQETWVQLIWRSFHWLHHVNAHHGTVPGAVNWWIAAAAVIGGIHFAIGSFAGVFLSVAAPSRRGLVTLYDWLVTFLFFLGTYWFTFGCFLLSVQGLNSGYEIRLQAWETHGFLQPRPRYCWLGCAPTSLPWVAGVIYTLGCVLYNIGATFNLLHSFPSFNVSRHTHELLALDTFAVGGVFFLVAGLLYCMNTHGCSFLKGVLVPLSTKDATNLDWWSEWTNFWGGVGFCVSGFFLWPSVYAKIDSFTCKVGTAIGFGGGSVCFIISGLLMFTKMSLARTAVPFGYNTRDEDGLARADSADQLIERI